MRLYRLVIAAIAGSLNASAILAANPPEASAAAHYDTAQSVATSSADSATASVKSDVPSDLSKEATVTLDAARSTALGRVKGGVVGSEELEREHGKLIYSFVVVVKGKSGVTEVNVDAKTGKVLNIHHETPAKEKREAKQEGKPRAKAMKIWS